MTGDPHSFSSFSSEVTTSETTTGTAVVADLLSVANTAISDSAFFTDLAQGSIDRAVLRGVFEQYYLWRNAFHRWFGVITVLSPPFGIDFDTGRVLYELAEHTMEEITGDHHGLCRQVITALGTPSDVIPTAAPETVAYIDSFVNHFLYEDTNFPAALAALAGRELTAVPRNHLTRKALSTHYGISAEVLQFFVLHETLEEEHFLDLWNALMAVHSGRDMEMAESARKEIRKHVAFWDDVYATVSSERLLSQ